LNVGPSPDARHDGRSATAPGHGDPTKGTRPVPGPDVTMGRVDEPGDVQVALEELCEIHDYIARDRAAP